MWTPTPLRRATPLALGLTALTVACEHYPVTPQGPLNVQPDTLVFAARQGGLPPIARYLTLSSTGMVKWRADVNVPWLALSPTAGAAPQSVVVAADNQGLALGTHLGVISFSAPSASNDPVRALVRLEIVAQAPLAGRWLGAWDAAVLSLDLRDSADAVVGSGLLIATGTTVTITGVRTGNTVALTLQEPGGAPVTLDAFFFDDHVLRGTLTGPGFPGDSVLLFRQ